MERPSLPCIELGSLSQFHAWDRSGRGARGAAREGFAEASPGSGRRGCGSAVHWARAGGQRVSRRAGAQLWEFSAGERRGISRGALTCIKAESI